MNIDEMHDPITNSGQISGGYEVKFRISSACSADSLPFLLWFFAKKEPALFSSVFLLRKS